MRNYLRERETRVNILSDLRLSDGSFTNFTRMSSTDFEILLEMIGPSIRKQDTKLRNAVAPHIRLAITLTRNTCARSQCGSWQHVPRHVNAPQNVEGHVARLNATSQRHVDMVLRVMLWDKLSPSVSEPLSSSIYTVV